MWNLFKRQKKGSVVHQTTGAGHGCDWMGTDNYRKLAKEIALCNSVSGICVEIIAKSVAKIPLQLSRVNSQNETEIVQDPSMSKILRRPNPRMGWFRLIEATMSYMLIGGNSYLYRLSPDTGPNRGIPMALETIRPDRVSYDTDNDTGHVKNYSFYRGNTKINIPVDLITGVSDFNHLTIFNPIDDIMGASLGKRAGWDIDTDTAMGKHNASLLANYARPGMLLKFEFTMGPEQKKDFRDQLRELYSGRSAGNTFILDGPGNNTAEPFGFSPTELDFANTSVNTMRRIGLNFGIPSQILSIPGSQTFANYEEARQAMYEDTILPYLQYLLGELNYWLYDESDLIILPNMETIAALAPRRAKLWERATKADFLKENEKRSLVGYEATPDGDVILKPANLIPLGDIANAVPDTESDDDVEKSIKKLVADGHSETEAREMLGV